MHMREGHALLRNRALAPYLLHTQRRRSDNAQHRCCLSQPHPLLFLYKNHHVDEIGPALAGPAESAYNITLQ